MVEFKEKEYAGRLIASNTSDTGFAIVKATEVGGHRSVNTLSELYALSTPILSISGDNTNNDAIGQLWYVASEGKHYQLVDWANRKNANGWKVFKSGGGSKSLPFAGYMDSDITVKEDETATPTAIYWRSALNTFIALSSDGTYYFGWKETDTIPAREDYLTTGNSFINTSNNTLYISTSNQLSRATRPRVAYGTCSTAGNVAEKEIVLHSDFADWKLEVGAEFVVKSTYTNSASNVTLNVNNTGAKQIMYRGALYTSASNIVTYANQLIRYIFDGTYYVWMGRSNEYTYSPQSLGIGYGICETASTTAAKTATISGYSLIKNGIVSVKFTNSVPANSTLNINNQGAKPIFYRGAKIVAGVINAGDVVTFIYDGANYIYLGTDNALSKAGGKMTGGISWETTDAVESTINADGYEYNEINVVSMDDDGDVVVTGDKIVKKGGTSDQVLLADGSVAGTITTAWLEANLT